MMADLNELLSIARKASKEASKAIIKIYESGDFSVDAKADNSPLTKADKAGHEVIVSLLEETGIPILSEEGKSIPYDERKGWEYLWIVDPLDGTKEFIKKNGEFTVNIALVKQGVPVMGVVEAPVLDKQFYGIVGEGAWLCEKGVSTKLDEIKELDLSKSGLRVVASRSHLNKETEDFLNSLKEPKIVSMGSSLKFMMIAEGLADVYPRYAPTMEWDTAAADAIIRVLGGKVVDMSYEMLSYNKENLLNSFFKAF